MLTNEEGAQDKAEGKTVFEANKVRPGDKRKREKNTDASDVEGYLGKWRKLLSGIKLILLSNILSRRPQDLRIPLFATTFG